MARTKLDKLNLAINDHFGDALAAAVAKKFRRLRIETRLNIFSLSLISERKDGKPFTKEQVLFMKAFEDGYLEAKRLVFRSRV